MKKRMIRIPTKYILTVLTVLCCACIVMSFVNDSFAKPMKNGLAHVVIPMQKGINQMGTWITKQSDKMKKLKTVMKENESLKKEMDTLTLENSELVQQRSDLERYRELLELGNTYDYPMVAASIISGDPTNWNNTFVIDKGKDHEFEEGMNVIGGGGLVGIIEEVGTNYSKVRSIVDDSSNVSAQFATSSDICIVEGDLKMFSEGVLQISQISKDTKVTEGEMIVTSQFSSKYLPGILIGYVKTVKEDPNNLTQSGTMTPAVDFRHLQEVYVITELKYTGQEEE